MSTQPEHARVAATERIAVLDVLRGVALLGMFLVHFTYYSSGGGRAGGLYESFVGLMLEERFWAMFGMLFGVGFAIQLTRATAKHDDNFVPRYLRRLAALAVFGIIAHSVFGFNVLLGYATWGIPLLLVRRWSNRALLIAAVVSAMSANVFFIARAASRVTRFGESGAITYMKERSQATRAFRQENQKAQDATSYATVFKARLQHMRWFYAQWWSFLPANDFTLFLLGMLAFRIGLFDRPERHRRLIASLMVFGAISFVSTMWLLPQGSPPKSPVVANIAVDLVTSGFGVLRPMWLAFAYVGGILLLVAHNPRWLQRLAVFGWTGRLALTNYFVQLAILNLLFGKWAIGLTVTPLVGLVLAIALFLANAVFSRWWLARFRYGPLEWIWRSVTYARWQLPLALKEAAAVT